VRKREESEKNEKLINENQTGSIFRNQEAVKSFRSLPIDCVLFAFSLGSRFALETRGRNEVAISLNHAAMPNLFSQWCRIHLSCKFHRHVNISEI
jgi:hypothetical protein